MSVNGPPIGLHQIMNAVTGGSDWSRRVIAVLVCYLDDSGTEADSPVVIIAGYVATGRQWQKFENKASDYYRRFGVDVLHTKKFHHNKGCFKGWSINKKNSFAGVLCNLLKESTIRGVSSGTGKEEYKKRCEETGLNPNESAFGFSFRTLLEHILKDGELNKKIGHEGTSFVVEQGNNNQGDILRIYNSLAVHGDLEGFLKSLSFVSKESCAAVQIADFLAFYSRRWATDWHEAQGEPETKPEIISMLEKSVKHLGRVAIEFG